MTVVIKTTKGGYSSFLVKFIITRDFFENQRVQFDPCIHKVLSHVKSPRICIYTKGTTAEMALKSAQNTHKRNKICHFRSLMKFSCVRVYLSG